MDIIFHVCEALYIWIEQNNHMHICVEEYTVCMTVWVWHDYMSISVFLCEICILVSIHVY